MECVFEKYSIDLTRQQSIAFCKFWTGYHKLPTELGKHSDIHVPRAQRHCTFCDSNLMGDEIHVLLECSNTEIV